MYAIFETGGKQYKVSAGDVIRIEKIAGEAGDQVQFENVLAFSDGNGTLKTGTPYLDMAISATVTGAGRGEKVIIFKFKSKKDYRKKQGHRQPYTEVEIDDFIIDGKKYGEKPVKNIAEKNAPAVETEQVEAVKVEAAPSAKAKKTKKAEAEEDVKAAPTDEASFAADALPEAAEEVVVADVNEEKTTVDTEETAVAIAEEEASVVNEDETTVANEAVATVAVEEETAVDTEETAVAIAEEAAAVKEDETAASSDSVAEEMPEDVIDEGHEKTASRLTKADIMAKLDVLGVEYAKSAKKDELLSLLESAESK